MATQPLPSGSTFRLDQFFRSDHLVTIRDFFAMSPELQLLVRHQVVQVFAIVDANVIQGELRWRLGSREKHDARSGLQEALDAGVLVLIAPNFLNVEIEKYLPAIAYETETTLAEAEEEWRAVQRKLHFYEPSSRPCDNRVVDTKDLPYINASAELGLPVYTRDKDLKRMGAPVLWGRGTWRRNQRNERSLRGVQEAAGVVAACGGWCSSSDCYSPEITREDFGALEGCFQKGCQCEGAFA
jgi:predicted nucleic acid-binding protein